ncbi:MAG TPA: hypothetical protein DHV62_08380 [Elusimicrobia bacterium]|nr:hypothetical protein [Elusimicrobiota bacterium]
MLKQYLLIFFICFLSTLLSAKENIAVSSPKNESVIPWFTQPEEKTNLPKNTTLKTILNFIPTVNHFSAGKWRKGTSDIWNFVILAKALTEPADNIDKFTKQLETTSPTSRSYAELSAKIKQFKELRNYFCVMVLMNYFNSVLDAFSSNDDKSFLGAFYALDSINYNSYVATKTGYTPSTLTKTYPHWGFIFGYRNRFEYYANMFSPTIVNSNTTIVYINWYSDFIIPYKHKKNLDFYLGLGFIESDYHERDTKVGVGGGIGFHPRVGASYILKNAHYFRVNLMPYLIWAKVRFNLAEKTDLLVEEGYEDNERPFNQKFGDNYGIQFIYRYKILKRIYLQTIYDFSKVTEPAGDYLEGNISIHRNKQSSYLHRVDCSLNYSF